MKKQYIPIAIIVILIVVITIYSVLFIDDGESSDIINESASSTDTADTVEESDSADTNNSGSRIVEIENQFVVKEISIPNEGEKITFETPLILYTDEENNAPITVRSIEKRDDKLIFESDIADYCMELAMVVLTQSKEMYISFNVCRDADGSYLLTSNNCLTYEMRKWTSGGDTYSGHLRDIMDYLGDEYDDTKSYYFVRFDYYNTVETKKNR